MERRLKVLASAYACSPLLGSEQAVGWGWVNAIARRHEVWVITADFHQRDIDTEVARHPERYRNMTFCYVPRTRWLFLEKVWPPAYLWTYRFWLRDAYRRGRALHQQLHFDLAHQVTYVGFRVPGYLWKLDLPFVWGPIGGLENTPARFLPMMGLRGGLYYAARNVINTCHKLLLPLPRYAFRKARGQIIAATAGIQREIRRWYGADSEVICEVGPPPDVARAPSQREPGEPLRLSWSGQHLPGKALPLLLRALAQLPAGLAWELDILGEGPCTRSWRRLARKLGIGDACRWRGLVPRADAVAAVHRSHVFVITSLKDLTSTVLLEALAQGVPVVCPDHCGFGDVITPDCGVKLPVRSPRQFAAALAAAIAGLARDEPERRRRAAGALRRIADFAWEHKAERLDAIYRQAVTRPAGEVTAP